MTSVSSAPHGRWALVTGASSGIGLALAREFAKNHFNLVVVARNKEFLADLGQSLSAQFQVQTEIFAQDLAAPGAATQVLRFLEAKEICPEVLVNNAGFGMHGHFWDNDPQRLKEMVDLHVLNFLELTQIVLKQMVKRGFGRILNVGSVYSFSPVPQQALYSATKSFMLFFSEALRHELNGTDIKITVLCPGITRTAFRQRMGIKEGSRAKGADVSVVARAGYRALMRGQFLCVPGIANKFYVCLARVLPYSCTTRLISKVNSRRGLHKKTVKTTARESA